MRSVLLLAAAICRAHLRSGGDAAGNPRDDSSAADAGRRLQHEPDDHQHRLPAACAADQRAHVLRGEPGGMAAGWENMNPKKP